MLGHPFTSPQPPAELSGARLQSWLRRRIATLESQQAARIERTREAKRGMNESIRKAQLEIDNLAAHLTIGVAR
jgi:hypothetical protein